MESIWESVKKILPDSSHEYEVIKACSTLLYKPLPNTVAGCTNRISEIDSIRSEMVSLSYQLNTLYSDINRDYKTQYDKEFTRLTALGRPSQAAIDSEIHSKHQEMIETRYQLEVIDNLRTLVSQYIRSLDQSRLSCIESWHDIRRVD